MSAKKAVKKKLGLTVDVSEAASIRIAVGGKGSIVRSVKAGKTRLLLGAGLKKLRVLKRGSLKLRVTATDKAGNRSAARVVKLRLSR